MDYMIKGDVLCPLARLRLASLYGFSTRTLKVLLLVFVFLAPALPILADGTNAAPQQPAAGGGEDFSQYLAQHQDELTPFFEKNSQELFKQAVPVLIGLIGWVVFITMLVGWGLDVLISRGFAFVFAPAFSDWKRSIIYATGRLFLSFVYTCLIGLGIVFSLGLSQAGIVILVILGVLMLVAFAAQIVWILYLYRTNFVLSIFFYLALVVIHGVAGSLLAGPLLGLHAQGTIANFIDAAITPKLKAETDATKHDLAAAKMARDTANIKTMELNAEITQGQTEQDRLRQQIEEKKNSDIYVFAQIVKLRTSGDLAAARDQLIAFPSKFPTSLLNNMAHAQLDDINNQITTTTIEQKQQQADAARAAAAARASLLERAGKGDVTLSEMRQALISKTRDQVKDLLGAPSSTGTDSWGYGQKMIVNPLTNEKFGLVVYFDQGLVQGVDYYRGGSQ